MATIQERMKERRGALGITQLQLAEAVGVREATINRYESGDIKNVKHDMVVKLSSALSCSPTYLMGWSDDLYDDVNKKSTSASEALISNDDLMEVLRGLSEDQIDDLLVYAKFLRSQRDKK